MNRSKANRVQSRGKESTDPSKDKGLVLKFNRWVDLNHCKITLGARVDSPEFENRFFAMGLAQRIFPNAGFNRVGALTLMSITYLAILSFRRIFFPLGDQRDTGTGCSDPDSMT